MDSNKKLITLIILSLLVRVAISGKAGVVMGRDIYKWNFLPRIYVSITNNIDSGLRLYYSCSSNYLPFHREAAAGDWAWVADFRKSFWGQTRWACTFQFGGETHHFDIYRDNRDNVKNYQCQYCRWSIRRSGPCALNAQTGKYDLCYPWDT
ncbi:S-protein homolog 2 [Eutrema salsugineum]|nr:S-protein homolog 2 [Eutrema salsugineum]